VTDPTVEIAGVSKRFGDTVVVDSVDLSVARGETVCIIGPSGAGKTTLLRCINHLERPSAGAVIVNGAIMGYKVVDGALVELPDRAIARQRARIGMVFQHFNLFSHLTVVENVLEGPLRVRGEPRAAATARARKNLARVGMAHKADAMPRELSGGQQQRVAIARALTMEPELMLFDEPTSALDPEMVGEVLEVMRGLTGLGLATIIVTHEIGFANEVADRVVFMDHGAVVEEGPAASVLRNPTSVRLQQFLEKVL
jgi:polar amino acid transport system ATP-binding protein